MRMQIAGERMRGRKRERGGDGWMDGDWRIDRLIGVSVVFAHANFCHEAISRAASKPAVAVGASYAKPTDGEERRRAFLGPIERTIFLHVQG